MGRAVQSPRDTRLPESGRVAVAGGGTLAIIDGAVPARTLRLGRTHAILGLISSAIATMIGIGAVIPRWGRWGVVFTMLAVAVSLFYTAMLLQPTESRGDSEGG